MALGGGGGDEGRESRCKPRAISANRAESVAVVPYHGCFAGGEPIGLRDEAKKSAATTVDDGDSADGACCRDQGRKKTDTLDGAVFDFVRGSYATIRAVCIVTPLAVIDLVIGRTVVP